MNWNLELARYAAELYQDGLSALKAIEKAKKVFDISRSPERGDSIDS